MSNITIAGKSKQRVLTAIGGLTIGGGGHIGFTIVFNGVCFGTTRGDGYG